ncbi:409_t:CDS:2, partial [Gigaspora rosea]
AELVKGQLDQDLDRKLIEEGLSGQKKKDLDGKKDKGGIEKSAKAPRESRTPYFKNGES